MTIKIETTEEQDLVIQCATDSYNKGLLAMDENATPLSAEEFVQAQINLLLTQWNDCNVKERFKAIQEKFLSSDEKTRAEIEASIKQ